MSRSRRFLSGTLFAYVYQACVMLLGLWLTPFYIHTLGERDYGIWLVALQVLNFLLLCDFGILVVTPRDIANASGLEHAGGSAEEMERIVGETIKVVLAQTAVVALVALGLFLFRPTHDVSLRGPVALILAAFVISYPLRLFPAVLQGLQDLKFLGQLRLTLWVISTALVVAMLMAGFRFYALAAGWCLQQMGHDLVALIRLRRIRPALLSREVFRRAGRLRWRWFARGFWVNVAQFATMLSAGTDILIVGRAISAATVVVYSSTNKLVAVLQNQPAILASSAVPGLSHMRTSESRERILLAATSLTQAMLLLTGAIFCVVLAVNQQFVTLWLGLHFFGGMTLTGILALTFLLRQTDYTLAMTLFAFGHEKLISLRALSDGLVSVTISILLVRHWGMPGVAFGFLCGVLFVSIPWDIVVLMKTLEISLAELGRPYVPMLWRIGVAGGFALAVRAWFPAPTLLHLAIAGAGVGAVYLLLMIPYVWTTPLRGYIQNASATIAAAMRLRVPGWSNNV